MMPPRRSAESEQRTATARAAAALEALGLLLADPAALPPEHAQILRRGVAQYMRSSGAVPLDRCLGLPTAAAFARARRDHAAAEAMKLLPGSARARAAALRSVLLRLAACGTWHRWRGADGVPADASPLQRHAFEVLSCGRDPTVPCVPSDRQLRDVARWAALG
jgi:hypothetical protein